MAAVASSDDLTGIWRLTSLRSVDASGTASFPYGRSASGRLVYAASGDLITVVSDGDGRGNGYHGRWRLVAAGEVEHVVEGTTNADYLGAVLRRSVDLDGDTLVVSHTPAEGVTVTMRFVRG